MTTVDPSPRDEEMDEEEWASHAAPPSGRMSGDDVTLASRSLARRTANTLTDAGRAWLTVAADPFHDVRVAGVTGMPTPGGSNSFVETVTRSLSIQRPGNILPTEKWDAHIALLPLMESFLAADAVINTDYRRLEVQVIDTQLPAIGNTIGALTVVAAHSGESTFPSPAAGTPQIAGPTPSIRSFSTAPAVTDGSGFVIDDFVDGRCRVIGCGFEVVNTTPELYRGGAVTTYRTNAAVTEQTVANGPLGFAVPCTFVRAPPTNIGEAMIIPGARQWEAADGAYVVGVMSNLDARADMPMVNNVTLMGNDLMPGGYPLSTGLSPAWTADNLLNTGATLGHVTNFEVSGAYLTGLSPETTLQVNVRWIIQRFPNLDSGAVLVGSVPPPMYDPNALALYHMTLNHLPAGVPLSENFLGEFFKTLVGVAETALPIVGKVARMIPLPMAQGIATAADMAGGVLGAMRGGGRKGKKEAREVAAEVIRDEERGERATRRRRRRAYRRR